MKGTETPMRFMVDNPICDFGLDLVRLVRGLGLVEAIFGGIAKRPFPFLWRRE
jgi:hypothetical protein